MAIEVIAQNPIAISERLDIVSPSRAGQSKPVDESNRRSSLGSSKFKRRSLMMTRVNTHPDMMP